MLLFRRYEARQEPGCSHQDGQDGSDYAGYGWVWTRDTAICAVHVAGGEHNTAKREGRAENRGDCTSQSHRSDSGIPRRYWGHSKSHANMPIAVLHDLASAVPKSQSTFIRGNAIRQWPTRRLWKRQSIHDGAQWAGDQGACCSC